MAEQEEVTQLAMAIFGLAKASAEYAAVPSVTARTGVVNPEYSGELLQLMQDSAWTIAVLLAQR